MQIQYIGRHFEVTEAIKNFVESKLARHLEHHDECRVSITFEIEKINHIVKLDLHLHGKLIHASGHSKDIYNSIDIAIKHLKTQLENNHDRQKTHNHQKEEI